MQKRFEGVKMDFFDGTEIRFAINRRLGRGKIGWGFQAFFAEAWARFQKKLNFFFGVYTVK